MLQWIYDKTMLNKISHVVIENTLGVVSMTEKLKEGIL